MIEKDPKLTDEERAKLGQPGKCESNWCKSGEMGEYCIDPYDQDVHDGEYLVCLCSDCHQQHCDDI